MTLYWSGQLFWFLFYLNCVVYIAVIWQMAVNDKLGRTINSEFHDQVFKV